MLNLMVISSATSILLLHGFKIGSEDLYLNCLQLSKTRACKYKYRDPQNVPKWETNDLDFVWLMKWQIPKHHTADKQAELLILKSNRVFF